MIIHWKLYRNYTTMGALEKQVLGGIKSPLFCDEKGPARGFFLSLSLLNAVPHSRAKHFRGVLWQTVNETSLWNIKAAVYFASVASWPILGLYRINLCCEHEWGETAMPCRWKSSWLGIDFETAVWVWQNIHCFKASKKCFIYPNTFCSALLWNTLCRSNRHCLGKEAVRGLGLPV